MDTGTGRYAAREEKYSGIIICHLILPTSLCYSPLSIAGHIWRLQVMSLVHSMVVVVVWVVTISILIFIFSMSLVLLSLHVLLILRTQVIC